MRSLTLEHTSTESFLKPVLLMGLKNCAQFIGLSRKGPLTEFWFEYADRVESLPAPPAHLVDQLAKEVCRFLPWRERLGDWWIGWRGATATGEREGNSRLWLGHARTELHFHVQRGQDGVNVELSLLLEPSIAEAAAAIWWAQYADVLCGARREST